MYGIKCQLRKELLVNIANVVVIQLHTDKNHQDVQQEIKLNKQ